MAVLPVTANEVASIITDLKHNNPRWDSISAAIIKAVYPNFIGPLTYILNMSITEDVFPSEMKLAKVIPLSWRWKWPEGPDRSNLYLAAARSHLPPIREYNGLRGENRGPFKGQQASASNPVMSKQMIPCRFRTIDQYPCYRCFFQVLERLTQAKTKCQFSFNYHLVLT